MNNAADYAPRFSADGRGSRMAPADHPATLRVAWFFSDNIQAACNAVVELARATR